MTSKGILPNVVTYTTMIKGLCDNGRHTDVGDLLNEMANSTISLDVHTFSILIDAYCEIDRAKQLVDSMVEIGLKPNIVSNNGLYGYCKKGCVDEAWLLFLEIPNKGLIKDLPLTYGALVNGLCKHGKHGMARHLFNQLPSKGVQPDAHIYTMIIGSFCQEGSLEEVKRLNLGCGPNRVTYNVIVESMIKQNDVHKARAFMEEMRENGFSTDSATSSVPSGDGFFLKLMKDLVS
ncbi:hypothetical protein SASPL_130967 [Salvia splendens]|uniref:Uncharacterized protein n=1 Tax=Salvia splendens TaxID=180675 RepID=A0A8X8ZKF2_SALSN|nr:hypothetical protein SASPL_130967 [Salvia splendens]